MSRFCRMFDRLRMLSSRGGVGSGEKMGLELVQSKHEHRECGYHSQRDIKNIILKNISDKSRTQEKDPQANED